MRYLESLLITEMTLNRIINEIKDLEDIKAISKTLEIIENLIDKEIEEE